MLLALFFLSGSFFFFFKIYLFIYDRQRQKERQRYRREKQAPCREPDAELDPGTPGPRHGPKAGAEPLSHPGIPMNVYFKSKINDVKFYLKELQKKKSEVYLK